MTQTVSQSPGRRLTGRGLLFLAVLAVLLAGSLYWLRRDRRYHSARLLATVAQLVLEASPYGANAAEIFHGAAIGMTSVLDPYSSYLSPLEYELFQEESEGEYVGIGVGIRLRHGRVYITEVYPQSPAAESNILPGDRIVAIDNTQVTGSGLLETARLMRGGEGAMVRLTIETPSGGLRTVDLVRRSLTIEAFPIWGVTRSGIGYIRWAHFSEGSGDRLAAILEEMRIEDPVGLVLDLRGNPGGLLDEAITAAGLFLPPNSEVCTLTDRLRAAPILYVTTQQTPPYEGTVIVIQDELTASASEVLIAALHDARRIVTVGRRTTGKGWVQSLFPIDDEGALRLSTARYKTPSGQYLGTPADARAQQDAMLTGTAWHGTGLSPDLEVPPSKAGGWETALLAEGAFAALADELADDWPAATVEDADLLLSELRRYAETFEITPLGAGRALLDHLRGDSPGPRISGAILAGLESAVEEDSEILFEREETRLLRRLWEERLQQIQDPDPGELDALFDLDEDLRVARDLIEQPDRLDAAFEEIARPNP